MEQRNSVEEAQVVLANTSAVTLPKLSCTRQVISHQNAIKLGKYEGNAWLHDCFCKLLSTNLETTEIKSILAQVAGKRSGAVLNGKRSTIFLQRCDGFNME
jgi:hypothetical protein